MSSDDRMRHIRKPDAAGMTRLALIAGLLALLTCSGCGGGSTSTDGGGGEKEPVAATVSGTIKVGTAPSAIALDSTNNKIYVTDFGAPQPTGIHFVCSPSGADIAVIDGATQTTNSLGLSGGGTAVNPFGVTLNLMNHTLYALAEEFAFGFSKTCVRYSDGIEVFDAASLANTKNADWYPGGDYRSGIVVNPTTGYIYVTSPEGGGIVEVRDGSLSVFPLHTISVGTSPVGMAVNATTNKIYVANSGSNNISVVDGASNSVLTTIADPNGLAPVAVAVNSTNNTIYAANSQSNNLTVIDGATNSVTTIAVGTSPVGIAVDEQTNFVYVANAGNSQTGDPGNITVINGATSTTQTLTDPNAKNPVAVAVNPVTNKIYVANSSSDNVTVIDGAHD